MRKHNDLRERGATTNRVHHHGLTRVAIASVFFYSSLSSRGIVTGGIRGVIRMTFSGQFLLKNVSKPVKVIKALYPSVNGIFGVKTKHKTYECPKNISK